MPVGVAGNVLPVKAVSVEEQQTVETTIANVFVKLQPLIMVLRL